MNTVTNTAPVVEPQPPSAAADARRFRPVLEFDAVLCAILAVAALAFSGPVARFLEIDNRAPLSALGLFVLGGAGLLAAGAAVPGLARRIAALTALVDVVWVIATVVVVAGGALSGGGNAVVALVGVLVAGIAVTKVRLLRS